jgi:hypothetical protein
VKVTYPAWRIQHDDSGYTAERTRNGRFQHVYAPTLAGLESQLYDIGLRRPGAEGNETE